MVGLVLSMETWPCRGHLCVHGSGERGRAPPSLTEGLRLLAPRKRVLQHEQTQRSLREREADASPLLAEGQGWAGAGRPGMVPVFWALTKATLLVSGLRRMKPHSLCMGLCVSGWKALNLAGRKGEGPGSGHPKTVPGCGARSSHYMQAPPNIK